jgi:LAS superfamily LD-carboxypeptidase LdcB
VIAEADIIELGTRAAAWLAAAAGNPWFMLAGLKLRERLR